MVLGILAQESQGGSSFIGLALPVLLLMFIILLR